MSEDVTRLTALALGMATVCGSLYLQLYWQSFDIQPFRFIGLSDVIAAASSFFFQGAAIASGVGVMSVLFPGRREQGNAESGMARWFAGMGLLLLLGTTWLAFYAPSVSERIRLVALLGTVGGATGIYREIRDVRMWRTIFSTSVAATAAAFLVCFLPAMSICVAYVHSSDVRLQRDFTYALPSDLVDGVGLGSGRLLFLGKLGDQLVFRREGTDSALYLTFDRFRVPRLFRSKREEPPSNAAAGDGHGGGIQ